MSAPITINLPHQNGRVEARRRIEAGFAKVVHSLPGGAGGYSERWEGDRLIFSATAIAASPLTSSRQRSSTSGRRLPF